MFLLACKPIRRTTTLMMHSQFLFNRFVFSHYMAGVSQVHLVFDKRQTQKFDPKCFERKKRDSNMKQHVCIAFSPVSEIPSKWMDYILCRTCKRSIIESIGMSFLKGRMTRGIIKLLY